MSVSKMFSLAPGATINSVVNSACSNLSAQGFYCLPSIVGPTSAMIVVQKDRDDGFKNFLGMGIECRATLTINGGTLNISIDSEWTNKIVAILVGWFLCLVPFITGIIGAVNQNNLPKKIEAAVMMAANGTGSGGMPPQGFPQQGSMPPQVFPQQNAMPPQGYPQQNAAPVQPPVQYNNVPPQADQFQNNVPPQNF